MLESGSWGHSVLQTPALVEVIIMNLFRNVCLDDFKLYIFFYPVTFLSFSYRSVSQ